MSVLGGAGTEGSADALGELLLRQLHRACVGWKHYPLLTWQTAATVRAWMSPRSVSAYSMTDHLLMVQQCSSWSHS